MKLVTGTPLALVLGFLGGVLGASSSTGCGGEARDCRYVCERYRECVTSGYDVSACRSRCEGKAEDRDFANRVDHCASCLEGRVCSEATSKCVGPCLGIVP
jgi:hypothetical protein